MARECAGFARRSSKSQEEVQFLYGLLCDIIRAMEYHFIIYDENGYVLWQFVCKSDDPSGDAERLPDIYNKANEPMEPKAAQCKYCTLEKWLEALRYRGTSYKTLLESDV